MVQQPSIPQDLHTDSDRHLVMFPTPHEAHVPPKRPAQSAGRLAFGVLPADDGGKVDWAVLNAPRPNPLTDRGSSERASAAQAAVAPVHGLGQSPLTRSRSQYSPSHRHDDTSNYLG
jgi:hypothetical protein